MQNCEWWHRLIPSDIKIEHDHPSRTKHCPKRCRILSVQPFAGTTILPRLRKCSTGSSPVSTRWAFFSCCTWMCDLVEFIKVLQFNSTFSYLEWGSPYLLPGLPNVTKADRGMLLCVNLVWIWYTRQASHLAGCWLFNGYSSSSLDLCLFFVGPSSLNAFHSDISPSFFLHPSNTPHLFRRSCELFSAHPRSFYPASSASYFGLVSSNVYDHVTVSQLHQSREERQHLKGFSRAHAAHDCPSWKHCR